LILLDTDHLSIVTNRNATEHSNLLERLETSGDSLGVPVICLEEQCRGWLARIHRTREVHQQIPAYERLIDLFHFFADWEIVSFETAAADRFTDYRKQRIRIGSQDLKIAAVAVTQGALLLSANLRDFRQVPGLRVENWLATPQPPS
jgi:tRNA(fMet)-specific endonuclease VapC